MWLSLVSHNYGSSVTSCAQVAESLAGQCERAAKNQVAGAPPGSALNYETTQRSGHNHLN